MNFVGVTVITKLDDGSGKPMNVRQIFPADSAILMAFGNGSLGAMFPNETSASKVESIDYFDSIKDAIKWLKDVPLLDTQKAP